MEGIDMRRFVSVLALAALALAITPASAALADAFEGDAGRTPRR
jgi:hypothetical protein